MVSMRRSRTCVIRLQLLSLSRVKYNGLLNVKVPLRSLRNYHEVATQNGGARVDICEKE